MRWLGSMIAVLLVAGGCGTGREGEEAGPPVVAIDSLVLAEPDSVEACVSFTTVPTCRYTLMLTPTKL